MGKGKLVTVVQFLGSLLALESSSGKSPLGKAHLKVTSVKVGSDGAGIGSPSKRLQIPISAVLGSLFFNVVIAYACHWGHWKLLFLQFSKSLVPAISIQRDVCVPEQFLSLPSYHFHARL